MRPKKVLFIHRSVGRNLIRDGRVYELVKPYEKHLTFSDYDHNTGVLTATATRQKLGHIFPGRNTYPSDLARLFGAPTAETQPILDWIGSYDTIVLKSCYPTTKIKSDEALEELKQNYQAVAVYFHATGQQLGLLTPPPMKPRLTAPEWASRAWQLSAWLVSTDFGNNIKVFDLFDALSAKENESDANTLRKDYRRLLFFDAHPNRKASRAIAPQFVNFLRSL